MQFVFIIIIIYIYLTFVASGLDINGCVELFWGDSTFTLL